MPVFEPSFDLQKGIFSRLVASAELTALVPPSNILDATARPEVMPAVIIGEGSTTYRRFDSTSYATIHVWFAEPGLVQCKQAVSAIWDALRIDAQIQGVLVLDNFTVLDLMPTQTRFMRDPHGSFSHGIVTVAGIMKAN